MLSTFLVSAGRFSRGFRFNLFFQASIGFLMFFAMPTKDQPLILLPYFMLTGRVEHHHARTRHASFTCLTDNEHRDRFLLSLQVGAIVVSVSMPFLAGLFMRFNSVRGGYSGIYIAAAGAALLSLILGPRIVTAPPVRPDLRKFRTFLFSPSNRSWRNYIFFSSINGTLALFSAGILNFGVLRTEFNLGMFTSAVALLSAVFILNIRRRIKGKNIRRIVFVSIGASGDMAGRIAYTAFLNIPALVFKAFCDSFLTPLRAIFAENIIRRRSDLMAAHEGYSPLEPYLFQELFILGARLLAFSCCAVLFTFFSVGPFVAARIILAVLALAPLVDVQLLRRIEKENLHKMTSHDIL